jgi:methylase of polypeptide subunit release factors
VLDDAGYDQDTVQGLLSTEVASSRDSLELPLYLRLLPQGERVSSLVKLFLLGAEVAAREAADALAPVPLERLEAMGVLTRDADRVEAAIELVPTGELLIACDRFRDELERPDHVLGLSPPTRVLASLTVRRRVGSALDVGTGNGLQALLAASHADRVVGVDVNPRALRFAEFNAALNGAAGIELREGNVFDPVAGEAFDLIVSNPPYVISPESEFVYRDSGLPGDSFCEGLVRRTPAHLAEGGYAFALVSWVHGREDDWTEPPRRWVGGGGCDALLLRYASHEPLSYAAGWNRPLRPNAVAYAAALDRWLDYYRSLGIEAMSWGALVLRRRDGANWFWAHSPSSDRIGPSGEHVERLFAAQDLLAGRERPDDLLDCRLALASDHRLDQTAVLAPDGVAVRSARLSLDGGLRNEVSVDGATVQLLLLLDGRKPLRQVLAAAERPEGMSEEEFASRSVRAARRLLELGFLVSGERS